MEDLYRNISKQEMLDYISEHGEVKDWILKGDLSENTVNYMVKYLMKYCWFYDTTPKELVEIAERDKREGTNVVENMLEKFISETKFPINAKVNIKASIKSFYHYVARKDLVLVLRISQTKVKPYNKPTRELLLKMEKGRNIRDIALIKVLSCGFREETATLLKWGDIWEQLFDSRGNLIWDGRSPVHVEVLADRLKGKGKDVYAGLRQEAFLYPNCVKALLDYKEFMEKQGLVFSRETPLLHKVIKEDKVHYAPITVRTIRKIVSRASNGKLTPHDLRRYAQTSLEDANVMSPYWIKKIIGHKVANEENPYSQPAINRLKEKFAECIAFLDYTQDLERAKEYQKLAEENKELKQERGLMWEAISRLEQGQKVTIWNVLKLCYEKAGREIPLEPFDGCRDITPHLLDFLGISRKSVSIREVG